MNILLKLLGPLALALTILPSVFFALRVLEDEATMKGLMLGGCVLWFVAAPKFMSGGSQ